MADIETRLPNDVEATDFATIIKSGLPPTHAILYFIPLENPEEVERWATRWMNCRAVNNAMTKLMGKRWQDMTTQERMDYSLELHYNQLSTTLFANNYLTATDVDKRKMDSARQAIEAKNAGLAGQQGGLEMFYADLRAGRVKLAGVKTPKEATTH
jgi:hypothetical protein